MQLIEVNSRKLQIMDIELCYFDVTKFGWCCIVFDQQSCSAPGSVSTSMGDMSVGTGR